MGWSKCRYPLLIFVGCYYTDLFGWSQSRYKDIAKKVNLAGPTSFAPLIRQAIHKVVENNYRYHVL